MNDCTKIYAIVKYVTEQDEDADLRQDLKNPFIVTLAEALLVGTTVELEVEPQEIRAFVRKGSKGNTFGMRGGR